MIEFCNESKVSRTTPFKSHEHMRVGYRPRGVDNSTYQSTVHRHGQTIPSRTGQNGTSMGVDSVNQAMELVCTYGTSSVARCDWLDLGFETRDNDSTAGNGLSASNTTI